MNRLILLASAALIASGSALAQSSSTSTSTAGAISKSDSKMLTDLAEANIAEIETGKLALEKSQNAQAKAFAQRMVDDHTAALSQLQTLAQSKGVKLPEDTDLTHKALAKALGVLKGDTFDSQYLKRAGVNDHQRTVQLLQKTQKEAKDPDLKAMAAKMLPTVQQHLKMAQQESTAVAKSEKK